MGVGGDNSRGDGARIGGGGNKLISRGRDRGVSSGIMVLWGGSDVKDRGVRALRGPNRLRVSGSIDWVEWKEPPRLCLIPVTKTNFWTKKLDI